VVIAAGDELDVRFFYTPELNTSQTVRADGMISLELVGDVQAAGVAPVELQNKLEELYSGHLVEPSVTVFLKTQYARYVLVSGQIKRTGLVQTPVVVRLPAANEVTLEDAIIMAGGYDPATADLSTVLVIRQKEGKRVVSSVDLRPVFGVTEAPAEGYEPFYVQPGDIVHLPETRIVEADRWVDQHINQLVPRVGFFISTVTGTTTIGYSTR
jgi:protein involved in polysaccharide export with SLBB domain